MPIGSGGGGENGIAEPPAFRCTTLFSRRVSLSRFAPTVDVEHVKVKGDHFYELTSIAD